ncbi:hypothetical protein [Vibrio splendidus]|uniref:hypothetical protein n=1 Tax=Vibrio splendidus TaxID=29497 RepID=UPI000C847174|nr:hypothetical protein [Vibrio splendidus]PMK14824.1 hypothetical protein BCU10_15455 [Vibrio splendidus]
MGLTKKNEEVGAWYPTSVGRLDVILSSAIKAIECYPHTYALKRNIAYNLQYLEFQNQVIEDIKLSSVLYTQTVKSIVLISCSVIESLLHYLLIINKTHSTTEWAEKITLKGNQKKLDGELIRADTVVYRKLESPKLKHMTFDAMIKSAKSKHVFGKEVTIYNNLNELRGLRNKVHLQVINNPTDTDWNSFNQSDLAKVSSVLYQIFSSELFSLDTVQLSCFKYLRKHFTV